MWYDSASKSLIVAGGASRPNPENLIHTIDHTDMYQIFVNNLSAGWKTLSKKIPYETNHVGRVTLTTIPGVSERHFAMGGQEGEAEASTNHPNVYELNTSDFSWTPRKFLPMGRGHISESTLPWKNKCGIIIVAGAVNKPMRRTADIIYYNAGTDTWQSIGSFPKALPTLICAIHGGYLYCQSGNPWHHLTRRIRIE
jgi:hypothetical protein